MATEMSASVQEGMAAAILLAVQESQADQARRNIIANGHIQGMNVIQQAVATKGAELLLGTGVEEASAISDIQTGDAVAEKALDLTAAVATGKQNASVADRTPVVNE